MKNRISLLLLGISVMFLGGCGYSTASLLPEGMRTIHVQNFKNDIKADKEISDKRSSFSYRPGIEIDITRKVIDRFIFDRHIDVDNEKSADMILKGSLIDFHQVALSYDDDDNVEEFRVELVVKLELIDNATGNVIWSEKSFLGQSNYDTTGPNAKSESQGINSAVRDLAERIVERTVETWQ